MSRFVRASKVRHVYADQVKAENCYTGLRLSTATGDHQYIKANEKYMAIPVQQGGSLAIFEMDRKDLRLGPGVLPVIDGHRGPVLDFDFNPFHTNVIATGGDDCVAKIWGIPDGGLTESTKDSLVDLEGHLKKISVVLHHPTVDRVIATGSADKTIKVWDIDAGEEKVNIEHGETIQGLAWSSTGELLASTCRDKKFRLIDGRNGEVVNEVQAHEGSKTAKVTFCPGGGISGAEAICTVGFTRQSKRQFKLWDMRKARTPFSECNIDQGAGVIIPFWDEGTKMLYLCGKGDANIRYYELVPETPFQFFINEHRSKVPCRGICIVPKRAMDTSICEVARFMKLCNDKVEPIRFICPRKSRLFQADLYPDTYAGKTNLLSDNYFESDLSKPFKGKIHKISMDPSKRSGNGGASAAVKIKKKATYKELENRVKELEGILRKNNIKF